MNYNSLVFLALLLCIHAKLCSASSNRTTSNAVSERNIQFTDVIEDVQYLILHEMNFFELLQMAQTNARFHSMATDVFSHKYRDYSIDIQTKRGGVKDYNCDHTSRIILIKKFQLIERFLQLFGSRIKTLVIVNRFIEDRLSTSINKLANVYASESVTYLDLSFIKEDTLAMFTKPFTEVETVSMAVHNDQLNGNIMPFDQLFPKLKHMKIFLATDLDYHFIDVSFPYLEHIDIHVHEFSGNRKKRVESLFRKNKQIRNVAMWDFPIDYVISINRMFPLLEKLSVNDLGNINQILYFDHVREFKLASFRKAECINKLSFKKLQSFYMYYYDEDFHAEKMQFFRANRNITKLSVEIFSRSIDNQFMQIIDELPNLREIKMVSAVGLINPEDVIKIIQSHEQLTRFNISSYRTYDESAVKYFHEQLGLEWHVNELFNRRGFFLEKKTIDLN